MKGLTYGTSIQSDSRMSRRGPDPGTTLYDFVDEKFGTQVNGLYFLPDIFQPSQGVFNTSSITTQLARAANAGKTVRGHCLIYPKRMYGTWWSSALTSGNFESLVDAHMEAVGAVPGASGIEDWDVLNEVIDGGGNRTDNPFYTVFGDNSYIPYLYQKAAALWPTASLAWCQDNTERSYDAYDDTARTNVLNAIEAALTSGAPIHTYNFQSHLRNADGMINRTKLRAFLDNLVSLGLKITVGELDFRSGYDPVYRPAQPSPLTYTASVYDAQAYDIMRGWLDLVLPYVVSTGGKFLSWSASDISNSWEFYNGQPSGERPSPWDTLYNKKRQWYAIRDSLLSLS